MTNWMRALFGAVLLLGLTTPAFATLNDSEQPGSVLVFHKFIRGVFNDADTSGQAAHAVTELEISAVCPSGVSCQQNARVRLRAHWVCPGCNETSFDLETTVGGTVYFNPEGVTVVGGLVTASVFPSNATTTIPQPACPRGYLIVWAIDGTATGNAIKFDGLIGDAVIRDQPNDFQEGARSYNATPIQAAASLSTGARTDVDFDGNLDFNGAEYQLITGKIYGTVRYEKATFPDRVETDLTLLTLDVASNLANPVTRVGLNFYTANEALVDTATSFTCWAEQRLTGILPSLTTPIMGRKGLVESTFAVQQPDLFTTTPVTLLGIVETKEFRGGILQTRDYAYSLYHDRKPVTTTFKP